MNSLSYLISYLCEYFKGKKHTITPFQKQFEGTDKQPKTSVLYFGYFNIDDVFLENKFLNSLFSANKNTPVFFTNIQDIQDITNLNFIGWKVDFEIPIFVNVLQINNFMHLQGGNPPRITFDTNFDSNLTFYGQVNGVPFSYDLGFLPASSSHFYNNNYFLNNTPMVNIGDNDYPCFIKDKLSSQIFRFDNNGQN